jgi:hypothetical protein
MHDCPPSEELLDACSEVLGPQNFFSQKLMNFSYADALIAAGFYGWFWGSVQTDKSVV